MSGRAIGAGVGHEKRRWMRIFAVSRLIITQKTRRSVRSRQRRDPAYPRDPHFSSVADDIPDPRTNVARATFA